MYKELNFDTGYKAILTMEAVAELENREYVKVDTLPNITIVRDVPVKSIVFTGIGEF